jgi:hypothetical protein
MIKKTFIGFYLCIILIEIAIQRIKSVLNGKPAVMLKIQHSCKILILF